LFSLASFAVDAFLVLLQSLAHPRKLTFLLPQALFLCLPQTINSLAFLTGSLPRHHFCAPLLALLRPSTITVDRSCFQPVENTRSIVVVRWPPHWLRCAFTSAAGVGHVCCF